MFPPISARSGSGHGSPLQACGFAPDQGVAICRIAAPTFDDTNSGISQVFVGGYDVAMLVTPPNERIHRMFVPPAFAETDLSSLHRFVVQHSFGLVISQVDGLPFATHIPILLRPTQGPYGALVGHFARANPQWEQLGGQTSLVIFAGPHAYVSPTWYEAKHTVPTWNYTAVHAYGRIELIEDREPLLDILKESVQVYEQGMPQPWTFEDTATFIERLLQQIVGFRMVIEKIEGKFKLNQNHPAERRKKVIEALARQGDENSLAVAKLMRDTLSTEG